MSIADPEQTPDDLDFSDFELGHEIYVFDDLEDEIADLVDKRNKKFHGLVRDLLREAFATFRAEGNWSFSCESSGTLLWEQIRGAGFWCNGFPVTISVRPNDLIEALRAELTRDLVALSKQQLVETLAEWRAALEKAEELLRETDNIP